MTDPFNLQRFVTAHEQDYLIALSEIRRGRKESHWMWYIFPQVVGLGRSATAEYYAIGSLEEAAAFLAHPYLGENLLEICQALLRLDTDNATAVFGFPDDMKLRSSMTLFAHADDSCPVFHGVLEKFYGGQYDRLTEEILEQI